MSAPGGVRGRPLVRRAALAAAVEPGKPAWNAGIRTALATVLPVLAGPALGFSETAWLMLGGFNAGLSDKGGAYRTRFGAMLIAALGGSAATVLGSLAGHVPVAAVLLTFAVTVLLALVRVYGPGATSAGLISTNTFLIAMAAPSPTVADALHRGLGALIGSAFAMLLALVLWPLRVYRPARLAIAALYRETAAFAGDLAAQAESGSPDGWPAVGPPHHPRIRQAIEDARGTLAAIRRGRQGESGRGERLLVLLQSADRVFPALVALGFVMEGVARGRPVAPQAVRALRGIEQVLRETARVVETEGRTTLPRPEGWGDAQWRAALESLAESTASIDGHAQLAHGAELLSRLHEYVEAAAQTAEGLATGSGPAPLADTGPLSLTPDEPPSLLAPLRAAFSRDSLVMRHALRIGVAAAAATAVASALGLKRGYWVTITVVIVLQPYTGATLVKGLQRVGGTVLGGIMAALVAAGVHSQGGIMAAIFVSAVLGVALQPLNYGAYAVFLTPTFVLLAEVGAGDWHLVGVRVLNTLLGGLIALVGAFVLWPSPESERLPSYAAAALRASGAYLDRALGALLGEDAEPLPEGRRQAGMATSNAEASFQRLLAETARGKEELEGWMALLTYVRRLTAAATTLATARRLGLPTADRAVSDFRANAAAAVAELADAVEHEREPDALPDLRADAEAAPLLRTHLERAARQLVVLHAAATRLHPAGSDVVAAEPSPRSPAQPHGDPLHP